jgi:hypothetical protein
MLLGKIERQHHVAANGEAEFSIRGLPELVRACSSIQKDFGREFERSAHDIARQVVYMARSAAHTRQQQLAASTLQSGTEADAGTVRSSAGMFAGSEFGGGMRPTTRQFPPYRGKRGYFLYPAMRANANTLNKLWQEALDDSMKPWDYKAR